MRVDYSNRVLNLSLKRRLLLSLLLLLQTTTFRTEIPPPQEGGTFSSEQTANCLVLLNQRKATQPFLVWPIHFNLPPFQTQCGRSLFCCCCCLRLELRVRVEEVPPRPPTRLSFTPSSRYCSYSGVELAKRLVELELARG